ncbi:hypothetical protein N7509_014030 [Penicillium cosmopolitanum]|uniref:Actin binding protein n=1 Tax=Penicillium cosmopolitanum TaxID=1131564 RepID=A0A9W9S4G4_9EURO|nr:uncharacterized protein N7509_014030 [Penicillium cosmopolitanum]KAJ5369418.1 hypothetical protein N7509_014030 [Penicillium cosmopolitanum]
MASLNLSTNGPSINKSYQSVVNATLPSSSPTYGQWALFSVSAPLVNAFQQDGGNKESVLKVQTTGDGELDDLIEEFSEGRVQFAYLKVIDPNTGLPKNVLIAWCGEGVPERTKGYFTSHLASVSKFLHGYHVQITARADGDLTPQGIIQRVGDASGSKYSASSQGPAVTPAANPRPPVATKPAFTPSRSGGISVPAPSAPRPSASSNVDDDGWGADAPPVTRSQLEKVQPAYQPTRVNLQQLKSENQAPAPRQVPTASGSGADVVGGGYQPIGKVDIAAIRRQAAASGETKDERPTIVKGSYEPVGKVDIAAIRARAQKPDDAPEPTRSPAPVSQNEPVNLPVRPAVGESSSERLTSLPKPKVANKFGGGPSFGGTKPPLPSGPSSATAAAAQIGSASRTFADQGGKTPAQLWAERKAKERGEAPTPTPAAEPSQPIQSQASGQNEWKSSYAGKSWATVQTVQDRAAPEVADVRAGEPADTAGPPSHVHDIRDQFAQEPSQPTPPPVPQANPPYSSPATALPPLPPLLPFARAPPIQVVMPVGRGAEEPAVADAHEEQDAPPPPMPVRSLQEAIPDERDLEETQDLGRATAEATTAGHSQGGIRAQVQFDYEKAEDNEIELREGEFVTEIEMVDEDWWLGVNARGEHGLFPGNYVEVVEDDQAGAPIHEPAHEPVREPSPEPEPVPVAAPVPAAVPAPLPVAPASSKGQTATALYDYEAAEDNEISFPENAKIQNVEFPDDDWWLGDHVPPINNSRGRNLLRPRRARVLRFELPAQLIFFFF